jgi:hypothetical protein
MAKRMRPFVLLAAVMVGGVVPAQVGGVVPAQAVGAGRVVVGPGNVEDSVRGVVRTAGNLVYVFAPDDTAQRQNTGAGVIRAWKANVAGNPTAFTEVDAAHHPTSTGTTHTLYAPDVRLDRNGIAHLVYVDQATTNLYYTTFSTATNSWGVPLQLGTGSVANPGFYSQPNRVYRNWASYGLVLDGSDRPHVVYASGNGLYARDYGAGGWTPPALVATGTSPLHVQLAMDALGNTWTTWMDNPLGPTGATSIRAVKRFASGSWGAVQVVDSGSPNVLDGKSDDQGPSIIVSSAGVPYVMYLSGTYNHAGQAVSTASIKYSSGSSWVSDNPPSSSYVVTHSPQIYGSGRDIYFFLGHDVSIHFGYMYQLVGKPWSAYTVLDSTAKMDGSVSVRWDPSRDPSPGIIDATYHAEDYLGNRSYLAQVYYQAVPSSSTDTTPPSVAVSAPANGATVSGSVTLSATASDNVAVASVQFRVDGVTLATDTTAPYATTWNSATVANGGHVLSAVATDTSGNTASSQISVTASNTAPPPASQVLLGSTTLQPSADGDAAGQAEAFMATASAPGTLASFTVYVDALSAGPIIVGLYTNAAGNPGSLLSTATISTPITGAWNKVSAPAATIASGTTLWIAVLGPAGTIRFRDLHGSGQSQTSSQKTLTALPTTWSTGSRYTDGQLSAYASS